MQKFDFNMHCQTSVCYFLPSLFIQDSDLCGMNGCAIDRAPLLRFAYVTMEKHTKHVIIFDNK